MMITIQVNKAKAMRKKDRSYQFMRCLAALFETIAQFNRQITNENTIKTNMVEQCHTE